jgi:hypothetical protein
VRLEGLGKLKNLMTSSGIEPAGIIQRNVLLIGISLQFLFVAVVFKYHNFTPIPKNLFS